MGRDRRLAHPLPGAHDPERGERERLEGGRVEAEVRPDVREPAREHAAGDGEALARAEHRLVGEVDHDLGPVRLERGLERRGQRHPVLVAAAQLLRPAEQVRADEVVGQLGERRAHHGRVVLPVDQRDGPHERVVTSSSIRPVYFS